MVYLPMRFPTIRWIVRAILLFVVTMPLCAQSAPTNGSRTTSTTADTSGFRVVSSISGSKGKTQNNQFEMEDPRTVFHVPEDRQVIVSFQWEGPVGMHHLVGSWRNPDGKIVSSGELDYEAKTPLFSCYWSLTFPEDVTRGLWALEVQIDGKPAGEHTFEITGPTAAPPPSPSLSQADIYQRAQEASVYVDALDANGQVLRHESGFFINRQTIVTAFQSIDGASSIRLILFDGSQITTNQVIAYSRWQDWALLSAAPQKFGTLERAPAASYKVGDTDYVLGVPPSGGRTIEAVSISGVQQSSQAGTRLHISWDGGTRTIGSPLLDDHARVIGILGGSEMPGANSVMRVGSRSLQYVPQIGPSNAELLVVPMALISEKVYSQTPTTLSDLASHNQLIAPLPLDPQTDKAILCKDFQKLSDVMIEPVNPTGEFSKSRDQLALVILWAPDKKTKSIVQIRIFDLDNREVARTNGNKISLENKVTMYSALKLPITSLQPGTYRADLLLGDETQLRAFFRVVE